MNWGPETVTEAAELWVERIDAGARAGTDGPALHGGPLRGPRHATPRATLRRVCEFLELPWDPAMLDYHERAERATEGEGARPAAQGVARRPAGRGADGEPRDGPQAADPKRIGRWRTEMSNDDREAYERVAGDLLAELGYEVGEPSEPQPEPEPVR